MHRFDRGLVMPTLQIRNLPDDVYQALAVRAERAQRSLAQQALVELRAATADQAGSRRRDVLEAIKRSMQTERQKVTPLPEELIRADRER